MLLHTPRVGRLITQSPCPQGQRVKIAILRQLLNQPRAQNNNHVLRRCGLAIKKMPSRLEPSGRASPLLAALSREVLLLLVVHRGAFELLALRIGSARCGRASLAIRRHHNSAGDSNLSAFLDNELQRVIVNLPIRSSI